MEKKRNGKHHHDHHHHKHGKAHHHKPLDAYALYELEHRPHTPVEVPSVSPNPQSSEKLRHDRFKKKRSDQRFGLEESLDYGGGINGLDNENVDVEAGEFLAEEHHKFKESKWMSSLSADDEGDSYRFKDDSVTNDSDWSMYNRPNLWSTHPQQLRFQ